MRFRWKLIFFWTIVNFTGGLTSSLWGPKVHATRIILFSSDWWSYFFVFEAIPIIMILFTVYSKKMMRRRKRILQPS